MLVFPAMVRMINERTFWKIPAQSDPDRAGFGPDSRWGEGLLAFLDNSCASSMSIVHVIGDEMWSFVIHL